MSSGKADGTGGGRGIKRSEVVTLVLLAGAGTAAAGLARLDPSQRMEDVRIYPDAEACIAGRVRTKSDCRADEAAALRLAVTVAPIYRAPDLCERVHGPGECRPGDGASSGPNGTDYAPRMAAYVVGATAEQKLDALPLFRSVPGPQGFGAFAQSGYRTGLGCPVPATASPAARLPAAIVRPPAFGGFGGSGRAICGEEEETTRSGGG